jgi:hypothetical protein
LGLGIREFQLIQRTLAHIEIKLVVNETYNAARDDLKIISDFKQTFGQEFDVRIKVVPYIEKTVSGKHNPIQSLV